MTVQTSRLRVTTSRLSVCMVLGICLFSGSLYANPDQVLIQKIKAAFVFNIAKFVHWPDTAHQSSLVLCHYRTNALGSSIRSMSEKAVHGLPVSESLIRSLDQAAGCHMLFIPRDQLLQFNVEQWRISDSYIMTIADLTNQAAQKDYGSNAIINLVRQGQRIGLEINLREVQKTPLKISSELLKLARIRR